MSITLDDSATISLIENGSVLDHIPAGKGWRLFLLLQLEKHKNRSLVGCNLPSKTLGKKDLIKIEGREIERGEASRLAIFAPSTTVVIIRNSAVVHKYQVPLPESIDHVVVCPNPHCITNHEKTNRRVLIEKGGRQAMLSCAYCGRSFSQNDSHE